MGRPATPADIETILDRLTQLPRLGKPLRGDPDLRERLRLNAQLGVEKLALPRSEIERGMRSHLHDLL